MVCPSCLPPPPPRSPLVCRLRWRASRIGPGCKGVNIIIECGSRVDWTVMILIIIKINIYCDACVSTSNIFLVKVFKRAGLIENAQIPGRSTPWKARKLNFIGEWTTRLPTRHQNITTKTYCGFVEDQRRWVTCLEGSSAPPTIHKLVTIVWTLKLFEMISWW